MKGLKLTGMIMKALTGDISANFCTKKKQKKEYFY
jgi:hypothetical protein